MKFNILQNGPDSIFLLHNIKDEEKEFFRIETFIKAKILYQITFWDRIFEIAHFSE